MRAFAILLLSSLTTGLVAGQGFESCDEQNACISFFTYEEPALECSGETPAPVCQYKICAELNYQSSTCTRASGPPIDHTCLASSDGSFSVAGGVATADPNECNPSTYNLIDNGLLLKEGATQCQTVVPGGVAQFSFFDGACSGSINKPGELSCEAGAASLCSSSAGPECIWTVNAPQQCSENITHGYLGSGNEISLVVIANMMPESSTNPSAPVTTCSAQENMTIVEELTNSFVDFLQTKLPEHDMRLLEFDTYAECPQYSCDWGDECIVYCTTVQIEFEDDNLHYLGQVTEAAISNHRVTQLDNFRKLIRTNELDCYGDHRKMMMMTYVEPATGGSLTDYVPS